MPTHVWLEFPPTGGKAEFSVESAEAWQARGWVPCDPAEEPNYLKDPDPEPGPDAGGGPAELADLDGSDPDASPEPDHSEPDDSDDSEQEN